MLPDPLLDDDADEPLAEEIGLVLVATDDDALNDALVVRLAFALGDARVHALPAAADRPLTISRAGELSAPLFDAGATAAELARRFDAGAHVVSLTATVRNGGSADADALSPLVASDGGPPPADLLPLLAVREGRRRAGALDVHVFTAEQATPRVRPGDVLLALAPPA